MASKRKQSHVHNSTMSAQTKKFLQKICYKETASVDMTKHGFANDNRPIRVFIQPLRSQLEKLHDQDYKKSDDKPSDKPSKKLTWSEKDVVERSDKHQTKPGKNIKLKTVYKTQQKTLKCGKK